MFELDNDARETFRRFEQPLQVELPAAAILGLRSLGRRPMWVTAGGLDAAATLAGVVTAEYLTSNGTTYGLLATTLASANRLLEVGVSQLVPADKYRYI